MIEIMIFFLHFLMMASTLFCLSTFHEACHALEYLVSSSEMFQYKMLTVYFQEKMIQFILLIGPMPFLYIFGLFSFLTLTFSTEIAFEWFLFIFLFGEFNMTFLSKEWLEVISRYNFLCLFLKLIIILLMFDGYGQWCWRVIALWFFEQSCAMEIIDGSTWYFGDLVCLSVFHGLTQKLLRKLEWL